HELGHEGLENARVRSDEVESGLPGVLLCARGDDHDVAAVDDREVAAAGDARRAGELSAVREVEHLGLDLLCLNVIERDLASRLTNEAGVGERGADSACADDGDLGVLDDSHTPILAASQVITALISICGALRVSPLALRH